MKHLLTAVVTLVEPENEACVFVTNGVTICSFKDSSFKGFRGKFSTFREIKNSWAGENPVKLSKFEPFFDNRR